MPGARPDRRATSVGCPRWRLLSNQGVVAIGLHHGLGALGDGDVHRSQVLARRIGEHQFHGIAAPGRIVLGRAHAGTDGFKPADGDGLVLDGPAVAARIAVRAMPGASLERAMANVLEAPGPNLLAPAVPQKGRTEPGGSLKSPWPCAAGRLQAGS